MGWREEYRQASFRGAPFFVATADSAYGRRVATHEHAQRDVPFNEDMGRKVRNFTVDAYLLGPNYNTARDALIEACETEGAGTLVHPYRGDLTVNCTDLRVSESSAELSYCRVSLSFVEAGSASFPKTKIDSVNAISSSANVLEGASFDSFVEDFLTDGFPGYVLDAAAGTVKDIADFLKNPNTTLQGTVAAISTYYAKCTALYDGALSLARFPQDLAASIQNVMGDMIGAFGSNSGKALSNTYKKFTVPYSGSSDTPSRAQEKKNYVALQDLTRLTAIGENSKVAAIKTSNPSPSQSGSSSSSGGSVSNNRRCARSARRGSSAAGSRSRGRGWCARRGARLGR